MARYCLGTGRVSHKRPNSPAVWRVKAGMTMAVGSRSRRLTRWAAGRGVGGVKRDPFLSDFGGILDAKSAVWASGWIARSRAVFSVRKCRRRPPIRLEHSPFLDG